VPSDQLLGGQEAPSANRPHVSDLDAVSGDAEGLAGLDRICSTL
jgi:hypothetical protein